MKQQSHSYKRGRPWSTQRREGQTTHARASIGNGSSWQLSNFNRGTSKAAYFLGMTMVSCIHRLQVIRTTAPSFTRRLQARRWIQVVRRSNCVAQSCRNCLRRAVAWRHRCMVEERAPPLQALVLMAAFNLTRHQPAIGRERLMAAISTRRRVKGGKMPVSGLGLKVDGGRKDVEIDWLDSEA